MTKHIGLSFLALFFALASFAEMLPTKAQVVLTKKTHGGYVPIEYQGWESKTMVFDNGAVFYGYKKNYQSPMKYKKLSHINKKIMDKIMEQVATLENGELVFPNDPECMDAPTTTYVANNESGTIKFAERSMCLEGYLSGSSQAYKLKSIVDGQSTLANMLER